MLERVLKLSIPTLYWWLAMFYTLFDLWLNIVAEVLRFGDREFYKVRWVGCDWPYPGGSLGWGVHGWAVCGRCEAGCLGPGLVHAASSCRSIAAPPPHPGCNAPPSLPRASSPPRSGGTPPLWASTGGCGTSRCTSGCCATSTSRCCATACPSSTRVRHEGVGRSRGRGKGQRSARGSGRRVCPTPPCRHLLPARPPAPDPTYLRPDRLLHLCGTARGDGGRAAAHGAAVGLLGPHGAGAWVEGGAPGPGCMCSPAHCCAWKLLQSLALCGHPHCTPLPCCAVPWRRRCR